MIEATFQPGTESVSAYGLWQYDYNQDLVIHGLDLPAVIRIDFSLSSTNDGSAIPVDAVTTDGVTVARIPNILLQAQMLEDYRIYAFLYVIENDTGETVRKIRMPVKARPKPDGQDTPVEQDAFSRTVETVSELTAQAQESAGNARESAESAGESLEAIREIQISISESEDNAKASENSALTSARNAATSEENAAGYARDAESAAQQAGQSVSTIPQTINAALEQAKESGEFKGDKGDPGIQGPKGDPGEAGPKGNDGYTPVKGVDYFDGQPGDTGKAGNGIASTVLNADYTLTLTFTDGTSYTTPSIRGEQGIQGIQGPKGEKGDTGEQGAQGPKGDLVNEYSVEYEFETNRVLNNDGTLGNGEVTAVVSKFIPVKGGTHYKYKGAWYLSARCGVCCYDESKAFISILVGSDNYPTHKLAELVDFTIPENAYFMKIASNNITDYPLELVAVEHTIKTLQNDVGTLQNDVETLQNDIKKLNFKNSLNKNLLPLGNNLKLENKFQCFARKDTGFTAGKIESPVVFWDSNKLMYGMTFSGYGKNTDGSYTKGNIGIAWSNDLENWIMEETPLFTESGVSGTPDYGSVTGGYVFIEDGVYYLFYIGCSEPGYEQGTKTICVASGTDIHNLQRSTKNPLIAPTGGYKWTSDAIYKPSVYHIGDKYYMFFNAQGWCNNDTQFFGESIGYATSNDLINWDISKESVVKPTRGDNTAPDSYIVGDASIYDIGDDNIYMSYYAYGHGQSEDDGKDWLAFTTKKDFPSGWKKYGNPITLKKWDAKPCIIYRKGVQYHFCGAGGNEISCYKSN